MHKQGFTLMEIIVGVGLFLIILGAVFGMVQLIIEGVGQTRVRHTARLLATEKIEEARNLSYSDLGTVGGIPSGPLETEYEVELGSLVFKVKTDVVYIDDPFDLTAPDDPISTDYKRVRVSVSWGGKFGSGKRPVVLTSDVAPQGVETDVGGGTLSLIVFNAQGEPLSGVGVKIVNTQVDPNIDLDITTDSFGRVLLPGAPASIGSYKITVTKTGYSTDRTYGEDEVTNPVKPHLSVIQGEVTQASFVIDRLSTLTLQTFGERSAGFPRLGNVSFRLYGEKIIGTDASENEIYKYDEILETGADGKIVLENIEFDSYRIEIADPSYNLSGSNPPLPLSVAPDSQASLDLALAPGSTNSLLVLVEKGEGEPLASASARLYKESVGYDETIMSGDPQDPDFGHAYFGNLQSSQYDLEVSLEGYEEATASLQIDGQTKTEIIMNPI